MAIKRNGRKRLWFVSGLVLMSSLLILVLSMASAAVNVWAQPVASLTSSVVSIPTCTPVWQLVNSPNLPGGDNRLLGLEAVSPNDVWAVGIVGDGGGSSQPLMMHWQGTQWTNEPGPPGVTGWLKRASALASDDVWAVGNRAIEGQGNFTLAMHWNGTQWNDSPTPNLSPDSNGLYGVAAFASDDVWAGGNYRALDGTSRNQIIHWDGSEWSEVPSPKVGKEDDYVFAMSGASTDDVWVAGAFEGESKLSQPLTEHWDGTEWSLIPSPKAGYQSVLNAIAAVSEDDVWAAGAYRSEKGVPVDALLMHWDGVEWSIVPSPHAGSGDNILDELAVVSANDVWAVGISDADTLTPRTLTMHWDGTQWSIVPSQNVNSLTNHLHGVTALPGGDVWAAGWYDDGGGLRTLVERYACAPATPTSVPPSATSTRTITLTRTPTHTSTLPTATNTPTVTPTCGRAWGVVYSPNSDPYSNNLNAVAVVSPNDVWAVGSSRYYSQNDRPLVEHWDGTNWSIVPSPYHSNYGSHDLHGIAVVSANDVWAVGETYSPHESFVIHWDGSQWSIMPAPSVGGSNGSGLNAIAAVAANDVWAVGASLDTGQPVIIHWDGTEWSVVPSPSVSGVLNGIEAISANDIWAVGGRRPNGLLIEHWNGEAWNIVNVDDISGGTGEFYDVDATSASDVWVAGSAGAIYWNGNEWRWRLGPLPARSLVAISASDIWIVGHWGNQSTYTAHYDGVFWRDIVSPNPSVNNELHGVAAAGPGDVWAVGSRGSSQAVSYTLVERYGRLCVASTYTSTPTPTEITTNTPTNTPTPSDTGTPPTATNTHIPTCTLTPTRTLTLTPTPVPTGNTRTRTATPANTPTPDLCGSAANYFIVQSVATPIGGTIDTGNHCDNCITTIVLPFLCNLYGHTVDHVNVNPNGTLQFAGSIDSWNNVCLPSTQYLNLTVFPHWDDLRTDFGVGCSSYPSGCGIYTSVVGVPGDRIFVIEWRSVYQNNLNQRANFEVRLHERSPGVGGVSTFDVFYNIVDQGGSNATVGVQRFLAQSTQYECDQASSLAPGFLLTFSQLPCITSTPTWTPTATGTRPTETFTSTPTITLMPSLTPTPSNTYTPTYTITPTFTPTFVPCVQPITEGFEDGTLGLFNSSGKPGWNAVTTDRHTGFYSAYVPDVPNLSDQQLILISPIAIPYHTTQATLSFWHRFDLEAAPPAGLDGSVLEISGDGGISWFDATIISGGYNYRVPTNCSSLNPLAGRLVWSGNSGGWQKVTIDLMTYRGASVLFRFRLGTDETGNAPGWWIDDITVTFTQSFCFSPTPTATPIPLLIGHVNWEARPPQPDPLQALPVTLTLRMGATEVNYPTQLTDQNGFFTVTLGSLPNGAYSWRADDSATALHSPNYLANSGAVNLTGAPVTNVEMGLMRAGDANDDNRVSLGDFNTLKVAFASACGNPTYDNRADFTGDCLVNILDFNPLKANFGIPGAPPIGPGTAREEGE